MRSSARRSPHDAGPHGDDPDAESGVSEVVGFLLVFAILSIVLLLAMVAFNVVHERAKVSVVTLQAESVAQRVAASAIDAALFAEGNAGAIATSTYLHPLDLPDQLEGYDYAVRLEPATAVDVPGDCTAGAHDEQVCVKVPAIDLQTTAPLFSAGADTTLFDICADELGGGRIEVRFGDPDGAGPLDPCLYLKVPT